MNLCPDDPCVAMTYSRLRVRGRECDSRPSHERTSRIMEIRNIALFFSVFWNFAGFPPQRPRAESELPLHAKQLRRREWD